MIRALLVAATLALAACDASATVCYGGPALRVVADLSQDGCWLVSNYDGVDVEIGTYSAGGNNFSAVDVTMTSQTWVFSWPPQVKEGDAGRVTFRGSGDAETFATGTSMFIAHPALCETIPISVQCQRGFTPPPDAGP
jgi:hypothetical protein